MTNELTCQATLKGLPELQTALRKLSDAVAGKALADAAVAGALVVQNAAKSKAPKKHRVLSDSIHTEVAESDREHATVLVGPSSDVPYAAIQEFGGTVVPKGHPYLAIPLSDAAASYPARSFPGKLHKQGMAMVDDTGVAQYALATSVTIPPHPYLRPALDENRGRFQDDAGKALKQILTSATPGVT